MNAEEARRITTVYEESSLDEIYKQVKESAIKGQRRIYWFKTLSANDRAKLVMNGYALYNNIADIRDQRERDSVTISW